MVAESPAFLEPAAAMPVPSQVWGLLGDDDDVSDAGIDDRLASRTDVGLTRLIRLDRMDDLVVEPAEW